MISLRSFCRSPVAPQGAIFRPIVGVRLSLAARRAFQTDAAPFTSFTAEDEKRERGDQVNNARIVFHAPSSSDGSAIRAASLQSIARGQSLSSLFSTTSSSTAATAAAPWWWLSVQEPSEEETRQLCSALSVHPLTTEDIVAGETREKLDPFDNYSFISYRAFDADVKSATYLTAANMYLLIFPRGIVSLHDPVLSSSGSGPASRVERRLERRIARFGGDDGLQAPAALAAAAATMPQWIVYALIDDVTDAFVPALSPLQTRIDSLDVDAQHLVASADALHAIDPSTLLRDLGAARRDAMRARRLLGHKVDVIKALAKRHRHAAAAADADETEEEENSSEGARSARKVRTKHAGHEDSSSSRSEMALHLSDIEDHLVAAAQDISHMEETLAHGESNCLAAMNTHMARASHESSEAISKLTVLSTVLLPLNVITGLWGMNVLVPGQNVDSLHWFAGLATLMAVVASSGYWWATRFLRRGRSHHKR